jgi:hypothetical protein
MRNIMISGLPREIHRDAAGAYLDIMGISSPDSHEMHIDGIRTRGSTVYDAMFAVDAGGTLEITEKIDGKPSREVLLRGVVSAAAALVTVGEKAKLSLPAVDGPHILEGIVSFDPIRNRTVIDRLLGRESQAPAKGLAEKAAADVIAGFRRTFSRSPLASQLYSDRR